MAAGSDGLISLGRAAYTCDDEVELMLSDSDLEGAGTQAVLLETQSGDTETVALAETGVAGLFSGSITTSCTVGRAAEDGALDVVHGDVITLTYEDLDDGSGSPATKTDTADIDTLPPLVSGISVDEVAARSATVRFDTSEPATGTVYCGTSCAAPFPITVTGGVDTAHSLQLSGLEPDTTYYLQIAAADQLGNTLTTGGCIEFATEAQPDYFTEVFTGDNDLDYLTLTFTPSAGLQGYTACTEAAQAFATPVGAGAISLSLGDDDTEYVALSDGAEVWLYGTAYSGLYVNSNGSVSFTSGDVAYNATLASHFGLPRIDALFTDLYPAYSVGIYFEQLADRAVVTFAEVQLYGSSAKVSFQVELFFDGVVRITWLDIQTAGGIVGLSRGLGQPADFVESDLTGYPDCGAAPEGEIPEGEIPEGEIPEGEIPEGEIPEGEIPEGEIPEGEVPEGEPCTPEIDDLVASAAGSGVYAAAGAAVWSHDGGLVDASLAYQAFAAVETPDTNVQLFLAVERTILATIYAGQPGGCPGVLDSWSATGLALGGLDPGLYSLYFVCTTAAGEAEGIALYEAGDGGARVGLGLVEISAAEGEAPPYAAHCGDWHGGADWRIDLTELLRIVQFYNSGGYCCAPDGAPSDEGYVPGTGDHTCTPHSSDYTPQDWSVDLTELLRVVQFFNSGWYYPCDDPVNGEDGYCPGLPE